MTPRAPLPLANGSSGFTLLELLIVMAIIGMIAAFVAPRIGGGSAALFQAQLREAVAALNYARRSAIVNGRPMEASFQEVSGAERARADDPGQWISRGVTLSVGKGRPLAEGSAPVKVIFFPEGGSSGGSFTLSHEDYSAEIVVDPVTGRITTEMRGEGAG